ncbi:MAG: hypothetical protein RJA22_3099 [Verrucomicrobiota bacterium]|jgi:endonuclease I/fibronectin type 3 domain-containing protein
MLHRVLFWLGLVLVQAGLSSLRADAPAGYYSTATGLSGAALRVALHEIINDHVVVPYSSTAGDTADALAVLDEDPANATNVWLVYAQRSEPKSSFGLSTGWNREHLWCNSYGLDDIHPAFSDLHNLRAEDASVNSARGNEFYDLTNPLDAGYANPAHPEALLCTSDSDSWQPPAHVRGDIARALFYMDVRYEGDRANEPDLILTSETGLISATAAYMGSLAVLLQWHRDDPVDAAEQLRNDRVYALYQSNRNPFIDHPEWVETVYGQAPAAVTLAQWTFNSPAPDANTATGTLLPAVGAGTASLVGGVSGGYAAGTATDPASGGTDNSGWNTTSYPAQGTLNKQAGVQIAVSTAGHRDISVAWEQRLSGTASRYARLQYSLNGTDFLDAGVITLSAAGAFAPQFQSLSGLPGVDNNPRFALRIVAEFESTATGAGAAGYVTASTSSYGSSGTIRLDVLTLRGIPLPPTPPASLTATAGDTTVSLAWPAVTGATRYQVNRATTAGGPYAVVAAGLATTTHLDSGLANGTAYYYVVTAGNNAGESAPSPEASATPQWPRPSAPSSLAASPGNGFVSLAWVQSTSPGLTGNKVYRSTSGQGGAYQLLATLSPTSSFTDNAVVNGSPYYYVVTAVNAGGESDPSAYAGATPVCPLPAAPAGVTATPGNAQVSLGWTAVSGATGYQVKRATASSGPFAPLGTVVAGTTSTDTTAANGTTYYYVVSAINACGEGALSAVASATPSAPGPAAPGSLVATAGKQKVTLTWKDLSNNETGFKIERSTTGLEGSFTQVATVGANVTTYAQSKLTTGVRYYYRVRSYNTTANSAYSNVASAVAK